MARRRQLYEGKAKILFEGPEPGTLVQYFKDDATAGNGAKKGIITGKGVEGIGLFGIKLLFNLLKYRINLLLFFALGHGIE